MEERYDRQIRLWGEEGQDAISKLKVCLLGTSVAAIECLRLLVLPGCSGFTIVTDDVVDPDDIRTDFLLDSSFLQQPKGLAYCESLKKINPDVQGSFIEANPYDFIHSDASSFDGFSVVIVSNLTNTDLEALCHRLLSTNILLVSIASIGFYGSVELLNYQGFRIDDKYEHRPFDFRILHPFSELLDMYHSAAVQNILNDHQGDWGQLPYPLLLLHMHNQWLRDHPSSSISSDGTDAFLHYCESNFKHKIETIDTDKWRDICRHIRRLAGESSVPPSCHQLFEHKLASSLRSTSEPFWFIVRSIAQFTKENNNILPLSGKIPDVNASTALFLAFQRAFAEREKSDLAKVTNILHSLLAAVNLTPDYVSSTLLNSVFRNIRHVHLTHFPKQHFGKFIEQLFPSSMKDDIQSVLCACEAPNSATSQQTSAEQYDQMPALWYLAYYAVQIYREEHGSFPGVAAIGLHNGPDSDDSSIPSSLEPMTKEETVAESLQMYVETLVRPYDLEICTNCLRQICVEFVRYSGQELHTVSSFIAAITSQEILKVVSRRGSPLDNLFVYNGISHVANVYNSHSEEPEQ